MHVLCCVSQRSVLEGTTLFYVSEKLFGRALCGRVRLDVWQLQGENQDRVFLAAQFEGTCLTAYDIVWQRQREGGEQILGDQEVLSQFGAKVLDSGGCIQYVAMISHFTAEVTHFCRNHLTAMGCSLEVRNNAVSALELLLGSQQTFLKVVEAIQRSGFVLAMFGLPGQEGAVSCDLVDFALVFLAAVGEQLVVVANKAAVLHVAQFLADGGGRLQINEHENQVFLDGILVLA